MNRATPRLTRCLTLCLFLLAGACGAPAPRAPESQDASPASAPDRALDIEYVIADWSRPFRSLNRGFARINLVEVHSTEELRRRLAAEMGTRVFEDERGNPVAVRMIRDPFHITVFLESAAGARVRGKGLRRTRCYEQSNRDP